MQLKLLGEFTNDAVEVVLSVTYDPCKKGWIMLGSVVFVLLCRF
jgi:hypothetical protein